jgi:multiple sugar transport system ATP-binding protein
MAKVSVQNVSKTCPAEERVQAIQDFNLEINDREFVVLAGPHGCGNCSILRMIAGLDDISKGEIRIGDKRVNDLPPSERDVAMVFKTGALYPRMSVSDNLAFGLKLRKFPTAEIKRRVAETAAILGIEPWLDRKPGSLSASERQRVALGRAIARQPKVFLLEEPLADLDRAATAPMRAEILRLHHRLQATIIYATHDPVEAMTMGDRVAVMTEGALQQIDSPLRLYREPENLFAAGYLGTPPMNLIRGKLREAGDVLIFKEAGEGVIELKLMDRPGARPFAGREVIAGVRPEEIRIITGSAKPGGPSGPPRFRSLLDVVELLGAESNAHIETGAHTLIARTPDAIGSEEAGHRVQFEIDPARIHLFDPETTRRITG